MNVFYTNLSEVLSTSVHNAQQLVLRFDSIKCATLTKLFDRLPTAAVSETAADGEGKRGQYGVVYTDRLFAYKVFFTEPYDKRRRFSEEICRLAYLKAVFKEIIIQTLLQSDAHQGHHVCHAHKLYRTGDRFLLKMDKMEVSLKHIIEEEAGGPGRERQLLAMLAKVFEVLLYFHGKYAFHHNDLHAGNIMTVEGDRVASLALIDFGNSSAKIGDSTLDDSSDSKTGRDDLNELFAYPPVHVSAGITALFATLANLPEGEPYETYLHTITAVQLETAWESAWDAVGEDRVDTRAQFKTDFNAAIHRSEEELTGDALQRFIDEYVVNYRRVLQLKVVRSRRSSSSRKTSRRTSGRKTRSSK